jgi:hypothetical protein
MLKEISIVDEDGKKIDDRDNLIILKTPDNMTHYIDVDVAESIVKSLMSQLYMIKVQQEINGE